VLGLIDGGAESQGGKTGQGHSSWCDVPCGEEDLDWMVTSIPGKGHGLIAIKDIPSKSRILVDGLSIDLVTCLIQNGTNHTNGLGGMEPYASDARNSLKYLSRIRSYLVNHCCDANAAKAIDQDYLVRYLNCKL
jgi:hypothetical protein